MSQQPDPMPSSHAPFPLTPWTLVKKAQEVSQDERRQLAWELLRRYWKPIYAYYRSKRQTKQHSQDLVQDFFSTLVEKDRLAQVPGEARFRHWLMRCARNFLVDQQRKKATKKGRLQTGLPSMEDLKAVDGEPFEPTGGKPPEQAFHDAWRRDLLDRAFRDVETICRAEGRGTDYQIFRQYYVTTGEESPKWTDVAHEYRFDHWKTAANKADWVKKQLAGAIRRHVREYVDTDEEVDEEIRQLLM